MMLSTTSGSISRAIIVATTKPISVEKCGIGFAWSFKIGPTGHYWRAGGRTVWTEEEARADAERVALGILAPYRDRIPEETDTSFAEFATICGIRKESL